MEITIITGLSAIGDMKIYSGQTTIFDVKVMCLKKSYFLLAILILAIDLFAQEKVYRIEYINVSDQNIINESGSTDSATFILKVNDTKNRLFSEGFLLANLDDLQFTKDSMIAILNVGDRFVWQAMGVKNIPDIMVSKAGYRTQDFENIAFSEKQLNRLIQKLLTEASRTGYPFASFEFSDVSITGNRLRATLNYNPGPVIHYDSLTVYPTGLINSSFLESYLNVKEGSLFNMQNVGAIPKVIDQLSFCRLNDSTLTSFRNNKCNIELQLEPVKANKVDALIGLLPDRQRSSGVMLTGYINLHLNNLFKSGKELSFVWQQFQKESQKLNLNYSHPNMLRSPIGFNMKMDIVKQDTAFLNTNFELAGYYYQNQVKIMLTTNFRTSRSLGIPEDPFSVPDVLDFNMQQIGLDVSYNSLDDLFNPLNGIRLNAEATLGNKNVLESSNLDQSVYDSISLKSIQNEIRVGGEINKRISRSMVIHLDADAGWVLNNNGIYYNDLLRIGGVNSLRGFNDLDILVSSYMLFRFEPRLIINSTSRLFLFYDQGFIYNEVEDIRDSPGGFGAGLVLDTGLG